MAAIWASVNAAVQDMMNCPRVLDAQLVRHWLICQHADGLYYSPDVSKHVIKVMHESGRR
jgi:hypothetical protein